MRSFFTVLLMTLLTFSLCVQTVHAKRFGGGRSMGVTRSVSSFSQPKSFQTARQNASPNRWLGPLAGLAAGGLLASLFMGHGLGSGILSWLMIGGVALLAMSLLRSFKNGKMRAAPAPMYKFDDYQNNFSSSNNNNMDSDAFLRQAKVQFIRLQAAYDQKNLNDIRQFTSPEVFAEVQLQLQERGDAINKTEVISLEAQMVDTAASSSDDPGMLSVRFTGLIREESDAPGTSLNEVWHFQKNGDNLRVCGIQQNN